MEKLKVIKRHNYRFLVTAKLPAPGKPAFLKTENVKRAAERTISEEAIPASNSSQSNSDMSQSKPHAETSDVARAEKGEV